MRSRKPRVPYKALSAKPAARGGMDYNEWPPREVMASMDISPFGDGWAGPVYQTIKTRVFKNEDFPVLQSAYLATERTAAENEWQDLQGTWVVSERRSVPDNFSELIYNLLKAEGGRAFQYGLLPEHLLLTQSASQGLSGEFWRAQNARNTVVPIVNFFERGRCSEVVDTQRVHALLGVDILTSLIKKDLKLPDYVIELLGERLPMHMKAALLQSEYFEKAGQKSLFTKHDAKALPATIEALEDQPLLEGPDRIAALAQQCLKGDTLTPLQEALSILGQSSDGAVIDAALHINQAFDLLPKSFASLRDMVNALKPGAYSVALPKPAAAPKGVVGRFKALMFPPKAAAPVQKSASEHYQKAVNDLQANTELFNRAENTLFGLNRSSLERGRAVKLFADDIRAYLAREDGVALASESPMLHRKLGSAVSLLDNSAQALEVSADLLGSFSERINVVGASVTQALIGTNVSMVVHTAERIIEDESNRMSFDGALDKMLDMARWVTVNYKVNATAINGQHGEQLLLQAQTLEDDIKTLKQTMRPKASQPADAPSAP